MGAWGSGSFENDDALDWLTDFCDDPDKGLIADALTMSPKWMTANIWKRQIAAWR